MERGVGGGERIHVADGRAGEAGGAWRRCDGTADRSEVVKRFFEFGNVFCETCVANGLPGKTGVEFFHGETVPALLDFMKYAGK